LVREDLTFSFEAFYFIKKKIHYLVQVDLTFA